jgi:hypothetical protein
MASAQPSAFLVAPGGERLEPGSEQKVRWNLDPSTARGRDEMELVLSLDGGRTFPVRLTGRISPRTRSAAWRVPALSTERATLALRMGTDEDADAEEIVAVSEPFAIASAPADDVEELYAVAGEWRTREALEGAPVRPLPRDVGSERDARFAHTHLDADSFEEPPAAEGLRPARDAVSPSACATLALEQAASPRPPRPPLPLRL